MATPIILLALYQATAPAHGTADWQSEGALVNEDEFQPFIQPNFHIALRTTGTAGPGQDIPRDTEGALYRLPSHIGRRNHRESPLTNFISWLSIKLKLTRS